MTTPTVRPVRRLVALVSIGLVVALLASALGAIVAGAPASAVARVSISTPHGGVKMSAEGPTSITVTGTGFQSVQAGFGGIYVFFGWVEPGQSWRPSNGGRTGEDYLYVPDTEALDNAGYQRFVTFPGSSTAEAANGGEVSADGRFSFDMVIPGPRFAARDRNQNIQEVDCLQVTCGIITIGAHGVVNSSNETFTPVEFVTSSGAAPAADNGTGEQLAAGGAPTGAAVVPNAGSAAPAPAAPSGTVTAPDSGEPQNDVDPGADASDPAEADEAADSDAPAAAAISAPATVGLDQSTIVAGRVLAFTGRGFAPGEQVMATLGGGHAVVGPLTAGEYGEVVGTFALAPDLRAGTYVISLTGAASGEAPQANVTVVADPTAAAPGVTTESNPVWPWAFVTAVVLAALLVLVLLSALITAIRRRRAARAAAAPTDTQKDSATDTQSATATASTVPAEGAPPEQPSETPPPENPVVEKTPVEKAAVEPAETETAGAAR